MLFGFEENCIEIIESLVSPPKRVYIDFYTMK